MESPNTILSQIKINYHTLFETKTRKHETKNIVCTHITKTSSLINSAHEINLAILTIPDAGLAWFLFQIKKIEVVGGESGNCCATLNLKTEKTMCINVK